MVENHINYERVAERNKEKESSQGDRKIKAKKSVYLFCSFFSLSLSFFLFY